MAHLSAETITAMVEVVINNNHRVRDSVNYQYQGDVLFFNAEKPPEEAFLDRNGWFKYMDGELKVHECNHAFSRLIAQGATDNAVLRCFGDDQAPAIAGLREALVT